MSTSTSLARVQPPQVPATPRWLIVAGAIASACLAIVAASVKTKYQVGLLGGIAIIFLVAIVRDRRTMLFAIAIASMQVTLHKAFSQILADNSAGIEALYVTTVDAFIAALYFAWFWDGSLFKDLPTILRHPVTLCAALMILGEMASAIHAVEKFRVFWGIARDTWMLLLFWYAAAHLKTHRQNWYAISALYIFILCQGILVILQYKTHRAILAQLLAERRSSTLEIKDIIHAQSVSTIFRPLGTAIHPDFLASSLIFAGVVACVLAITQHHKFQFLSLIAFGLCTLTIALTLARAAMVGYGIALIITLILIHIRRTTSPKRLRISIIIGTILLIAASYPIIHKFIQDFHQLGEELRARGQLYGVAWHMIQAHPFIGVGMSNFVKVMHSYESTTLIFGGNPVHSLYLLTLSESGIIGCTTLVALFIAILVTGYRATKVTDPLLAAIAIALFAALIGFFIEETITFSFREDEPLELFWLAVGWLVAIQSTIPDKRSLPKEQEVLP